MSQPNPAEKVEICLLHIDDLAVELLPGVDLERLAAELEAAMRDGRVLRVPVLQSTLEGHDALVNPALARLVYMSRRTTMVPRIGKPGVG